MEYSAKGLLKPKAPYSFDRTLEFLEMFAPTQNEQTLVKGVLTKAVRINGQTIAFQIESKGSLQAPELAYTLFADKPVTPELQAAAEERIRFHLSLDDDLNPFYEIASHDPYFEPVIKELYGYHQVKFVTPFENACWAIISQRNMMAVSSKMKRALSDYFKNCIEVNGTFYSAFPDAKQVAKLGVDGLTFVIHHEPKAIGLQAVAEAFSNVDEAFLRHGPYDEVEAWLKSIHGIGDWSANFIMLRGLGRMEKAPTSSSEKRIYEAAARIYGRGQAVTADQLKKLASQYGPCQGYWAHYLRVIS
ncbi:MAG TPA: DNA-3-methyladenine glycosylase 2 family protein [Chloroflexia bacterium]|nr:DNA-3-methyladenine glycosylase 2 family protein [Chloroflexia bacterium]